MIDIEIAAEISKVSLSVKDEDGVVVRKAKMTLSREFDDELAEGLAGDAKKILSSLRGLGCTKAVLPIDMITVEADLVGSKGERLKIGTLWGIKATASASDLDEAPTVQLEFETWYDRDVWVFLGDNCGVTCRITLRPRQMELPKTAKPKTTGKGAQA